MSPQEMSAFLGGVGVAQEPTYETIQATKPTPTPTPIPRVSVHASHSVLDASVNEMYVGALRTRSHRAVHTRAHSRA